MRRYIIDFIHTLTVKTAMQPSLVSLLFSDSRVGSRKGAYLPIQILLLLLIKEDMSEDEALKLALRKCLIM
jgi:hypothetical protein